MTDTLAQDIVEGRALFHKYPQMRRELWRCDAGYPLPPADVPCRECGALGNSLCLGYFREGEDPHAPDAHTFGG